MQGWQVAMQGSTQQLACTHGRRQSDAFMQAPWHHLCGGGGLDLRHARMQPAGQALLADLQQPQADGGVCVWVVCGVWGGGAARRQHKPRLWTTNVHAAAALTRQTTPAPVRGSCSACLGGLNLLAQRCHVHPTRAFQFLHTGGGPGENGGCPSREALQIAHAALKHGGETAVRQHPPNTWFMLSSCTIGGMLSGARSPPSAAGPLRGSTKAAPGSGPAGRCPRAPP